MRNLSWLLAVVVAAPGASRAADPAGADFFESKIRPILVEHCYACHSADAADQKKLKGGLKLDTAEALRKGGDSGVPFVEGKPADSLIVKALKGEGDAVQMPPKGKLPAAVVADFEKWVAMGAPDPRAAAGTSTSTIDIQKGRRHWAFRPPRDHIPPQNGAATPIDAFVRAKLAEKGLTPTGPADPRALLRRVYFDLIGLPPTPDEVEAFAADPSPAAYAKLIEKLLASPAYGERWARHWLDVARYSEDQAHTFQVKPKTSAFRYRDWVIRALNADMPFDRFTRLQIAGDLMPDAGDDPFIRFAGLGFFGLGAEYYGDAGAASQAAADGLDDRIDTLTRGFLGLTVACARCHDHKFDPVPQRDYYSLAGVFNGFKPADVPLASPAEVKKYEAAQAQVKEQDDKIAGWLTAKARATTDGEVAKAAKYVTAAWVANARRSAGLTANVDKLAADDGLDPRFLRQWVKYLEPKNAGKAAPALKGCFAIKSKDDAPPGELTTLAADFQKNLAAAVAAKKPTKEQADLLKAILQDKAAPFAVDPAEVEKMLPKAEAGTLVGMKAELEKLKKESPPAPPVAHVIKGGGQAMRIYARGNPAKPGDPAPKGFLQVLSTANPATDFTRLELADAIASKDNPLTARVIVNRVWAQHFGCGIVATPSNFGALGEKPTHPELLDWLTIRFVEHGWSLKWLHREILLSETYRQASDANPSNAENDGDNVYLWRANRRRLEVEPWRDALLAVSGRLDPTPGGPTTNLRDPANARRTVYAKISRHDLDGLLRLFDFPDANVTADKRTLTTVPQQQLFVLNSEFMVTQAKAFAFRLAKAAGTDNERIALAYRLAYGRPPTADEVRIGREFLKSPPAPGDKLTRWEQYAQALLAANEFLYVD